MFRPIALSLLLLSPALILADRIKHTCMACPSPALFKDTPKAYEDIHAYALKYGCKILSSDDKIHVVDESPADSPRMVQLRHVQSNLLLFTPRKNVLIEH